MLVITVKMNVIIGIDQSVLQGHRSKGWGSPNFLSASKVTIPIVLAPDVDETCDCAQVTVPKMIAR